MEDWKICHKVFVPYKTLPRFTVYGLPPMDLISYGDNIPEGDYRLHSAFANAINFRRGRLIVSLVPPRAGPGPFNLVLKQLPPGARRLRASRFYFYVDENRLRKEPESLYSSAIPKLTPDPDPEAVRRNTLELARLLAARAPQKSLAFIFSPALEKDFSRVFEKHLLARFKKAIGYFKAGDYRAGTRTMRGLGAGLTPSGDDFLSGMLAGFNYAVLNLRADVIRKLEVVYSNAAGKNLLSNSFLRASYEGKVNAKIGRLMRSLSVKGGKDLASAAAAAFKSGHTSGADFCAGLAFALLDVLSGKE